MRYNNTNDIHNNSGANVTPLFYLAENHPVILLLLHSDDHCHSANGANDLRQQKPMPDNKIKHLDILSYNIIKHKL